MSQASQVLPYSTRFETIPLFLASFLTANVAYCSCGCVTGVFELTTIVLYCPYFRVPLSQAPSCLHPSFRCQPYMPDGVHLVSYFTRRPMPLPLLQSGSGLSYSVSIPLPFSSPSLPILIADVSNVVGGGFFISSTSII